MIQEVINIIDLGAVAMSLILGATALARAILLVHDKPPTLPVINLISETRLTLANDLAPLNVANTILKSMILIGMSDLAAQGASVMEDLRMTEVMSVIHLPSHLSTERICIDLQ